MPVEDEDDDASVATAGNNAAAGGWALGCSCCHASGVVRLTCSRGARYLGGVSGGEDSTRDYRDEAGNVRRTLILQRRHVWRANGAACLRKHLRFRVA
jgi:hypothetical protein